MILGPILVAHQLARVSFTFDTSWRPILAMRAGVRPMCARTCWPTCLDALLSPRCLTSASRWRWGAIFGSPRRRSRAGAYLTGNP